MAMSGSSCIMVEQKRDFDLLIVLDALRQCVGSGNYAEKTRQCRGLSSSATDRSDSESDSEDIFESCKDSVCVAPTDAQIEMITDTDSESQKHTSINPSTVSISSIVKEDVQVDAVKVEDFLRAFTELTR